MSEVTDEKAIKMVKVDGCAIKNIDISHKNPKICLEAVRQNGLALQYVPDGIKTLELCLEAVKQNKNAFQYVPDHLKFLVQKEINITFNKKTPHIDRGQRSKSAEWDGLSMS